MRNTRIEPLVFWPALLVILGLSSVLVINPEQGAQILDTTFAFITGKFGWLYLWFTIAVFVCLAWLAIGKYGRVKLGQPGDEPEFTTFSWVAMLFCAGIGSSLLYWGTIEWAYYYTAPPFGVEPFSTKAAEWASTYGLFHWGFTAWAVYCVPTLPIAYSYFVRQDPVLRISVACRGVLGDRVDGWVGKLIDVLFMFGLVGGVGTSLGLGTPMISAGVSKMFGLAPSFMLDTAIIIIWTGIFGTSVYLGLEKGIKVLSDINLYLAFGFIAFVLLVGPTVFLLSTFTNSVGMLLQNFIAMSFWTDPIAKSGFPESWTMFYWGWWIAYAPFMGLFVAKISKGRTIRELIIAECLWGSVGCWVAFATLGNYGIYLELNKLLPVTKILKESGAATAIIEIVTSLPFGMVILGLFIILTFVFLATTLDSSAYTLAAVATKELGSNTEPERWHRLFWALVLAGVALTLLYLGGLRALQTSSIVVALPLLFVIIIMMASLVKWLKEDYGAVKEDPIFFEHKCNTNETCSKSDTHSL